VECVRRFKPLLPQAQIIMLTVYQNTEHIFNALTAELRIFAETDAPRRNCWQPFGTCMPEARDE